MALIIHPERHPVVATGVADPRLPEAALQPARIAQALQHHRLRSVIGAPLPAWRSGDAPGAAAGLLRQAAAGEVPAAFRAQTIPAAVLILLVWRAGVWHAVLTQRASHLAKHAGQIALPGGRVDPGDRHAAAAAWREGHEEIGLPLDAPLLLLGQLPPYTTVTGYRVTPVMACWPQGAPFAAPSTWCCDPGEVAAVHEVPLGELMNPERHRWHAVEAALAPGGAPVRRHFLSIDAWPGVKGAPTAEPGIRASRTPSAMLWGATAAMLRNVYLTLAAAQGWRIAPRFDER